MSGDPNRRVACKRDFRILLGEGDFAVSRLSWGIAPRAKALMAVYTALKVLVAVGHTGHAARARS